MGIIIFTDDDTKYRKGDYISMYGEMTISPTAPDTTFIYHPRQTFTEKDAIYWADVVPFRMVVVIDKIPKLTDKSKHCVIIDQELKMKQDLYRMARAVLCWADRDRAFKMMSELPIPYVNAFLNANVNRIELGRMLARCKFTLSDEYTIAAISYGVEPVKDFKNPTKKLNKDYILPNEVRQTDKHMEIIMNNDVVVSNAIRRNEPEVLPSKLPKRKQKVIEWI